MLDINRKFKFSTEELIKAIYKDPIIQAVIELRSKRIAAQQKRRMNSYGRWSKMMRDKYEVNNV